MELRTLFNILLLSLSLATVLITLVSYILYKVRQVSIHDKTPELHRLDGVFFKRFAPHLEEINSKAVTKEVKKSRIRELFSNVVTLLLLAFTVLAATLIAESYYTERKLRRSRILIADNYRNLLDKGLLRKYEFNPRAFDTKLDEFIPEEQRKTTAMLQELLREKKIALLTLPKNYSYNKENYDWSLRGWITFLKKSKIPYRTISNLDNLKADELIFLPQAKTISLSEREQLLKKINTGHSVLATGSIGILDGTGEITTDEFSRQVFGLVFTHNAEPKLQFPTLFAADQIPGWNIPPGLLIEWFPRDNTFKAISMAEDTTSAFEASYDGKAHVQNFASKEYHTVRANFIHKGNSRIAWLGVEPSDLDNLSAASRQHAESALYSSLAWATGIPLSFTAQWPNGKPAAFILSFDLISAFEDMSKIFKLSQKSQLPMTLFLNDAGLKSISGNVSAVPPGVELALFSSFGTNRIEPTLKESFDQIEELRLDIEQIYAKTASGIHPENEKLNQRLLNVAHQNRLAYVFGNQILPRFAPVAIAGGDLLFFPRMSPNDSAIYKNRTLATEEQMSSLILSELKQIQLLHGVYLLTGNTELLGKNSMFEALSSAIETISGQNVWRTTYFTLTHWWNQRARVITTIEKTGSKDTFNLQITNFNPLSIEDLAVWLDIPSSDNFSIEHVEELQSLTKNQVTITNEKGRALIHLKKLPGQSKALITLKKR